MIQKKIKLGVVFYGRKDQEVINQRQFDGLKEMLKDFDLIRYDFNKGEQDNLLRDFKNNKVDIILKNSYGRGNECQIESFLELNNIPFLGSGSSSTLIGTSKFLSKEIFKRCGLPIAKDVFIDKIIWQKFSNKILKTINKKIKYPCLIKDIKGTDSRGIYLIKSKKEFVQKLNTILDQHNNIIVEEFIKSDMEVVVFVSGDNKNIRAYNPVLMYGGSATIISGSIKDSVLKGSISLELSLANLSKSFVEKIKNVAILAHQSLGCKTFSRADILIKDGKIYLLEVDVHPGFSLKSPTIFNIKTNQEDVNDVFLSWCKAII